MSFGLFLLIALSLSLDILSLDKTDEKELGMVMHTLPMSIEEKEDMISRHLLEYQFVRPDNLWVYKCYIEKVKSESPSSSDTHTANPTPHPGDFAEIHTLLGPLHGKETKNCLFLFTGGWWNYQFCYRRAIHQYHVNEAKDGIEILIPLGTQYEPPSTNASLSIFKDPLTNIMTYKETYTQGDPCDVHGQPRTVDVLFRCDPSLSDAVFTEVVEPKSCHYEVYIKSPTLCRHVLFQPDSTPTPSSIHCYPSGTMRTPLDVDAFHSLAFATAPMDTHAYV